MSQTLFLTFESYFKKLFDIILEYLLACLCLERDLEAPLVEQSARLHVAVAAAVVADCNLDGD